MSQRWRMRHLALATAVAGTLASAIIGVSCKSINQDSGTKDAAGQGLFGGKTWEQEQKDRETKIDQYLDQHPVSYQWFVNSPLGVNGVPAVLLMYFMERYPEIWKEKDGSSKLAFPPHLTDYDDNGDLKPAAQRRPFPLGFGWTHDPDVEPAKQTSNVFFACGGCHINRVVVNNKMKYFIGGPSNEVEPQMYAGLLWQTGKAIFGDVDNVLEVADDAKWDERVASRVDKLMTKINGARIFADLKARQLDLKLRNTVSSIPRLFSKNKEKKRTDLDSIALEAEYAKITQNFAFFQEVMKNFAGTYVKANTLYYELGMRIPFRPANPNDTDPEGHKVPLNALGPKPGQMDAFGLVQGIVALNAVRPDHSWWEFLDKRYNGQSPLFMNAPGQGPARWDEATRRLAGNVFGLLPKVAQSDASKDADRALAKKWFSPNAANIDIKTLWYSRDEVHANWDGNQAGSARALASGVSSVGDPRKVDTHVHALMNPFIDDLPSPAYPFPVNLTRAEKGKELFEKGLNGSETCISCHKARNVQIYNIGTDMNRALVTGEIARAAVIGLAMEACDRGMARTTNDENKDRVIDGWTIKRDWCETKEKDESDIYRKIDVVNKTRKDGVLGYKADPLYGIWASAPYLHNGSVPTLYALLKAKPGVVDERVRPTKFYRGNVTYDTKDVGYEYRSADANYPAGETKHIVQYDTTLRGNSNTGHDTYTPNWTDEQIYDLIEYLKTM